jgi:2-polyprenyl-6-hydroxyphenyl methylase/3-demethylubiquinone-9 3-methyltransferase
MAASPQSVNNDVFATLGDRWYEADDDPVALLRAQARLHAPYIEERLPQRPCRLLDLGCGGGLIANELVKNGHSVVGVDISDACLEVAARHDSTQRAVWVRGDARALPFADASFDAVCAMDVLEHIEPVEVVVAEVARVLRPGGRFFFHTFDRTWLSWLIVIKGVEWFVSNVPADLHLYRQFVKPSELRAHCEAGGLAVQEVVGCGPIPSGPFWRMVATGKVSPELAFGFSRWKVAGYTGFADKRA